MWSASATTSLVLGVLLCMPVSATPPPEMELLHRRAESKLVHRRITWEGLLTTNGFRPKTPPRAMVTVLHLWAVECRSCVAELTWFRGMVSAYRGQKELGFVFVTETESQQDLLDFLRAHKDEIPKVEHYKGSGRIRDILQDLTQPLTLLLDDKLVIRQAFIGSIVDEGRKPEITAAIRRLLEVLAQEERQK